MIRHGSQSVSTQKQKNQTVVPRRARQNGELKKKKKTTVDAGGPDSSYPPSTSMSEQ